MMLIEKVKRLTNVLELFLEVAQLGTDANTENCVRALTESVNSLRKEVGLEPILWTEEDQRKEQP